jgi:hypothetical protein
MIPLGVKIRVFLDQFGIWNSMVVYLMDQSTVKTQANWIKGSDVILVSALVRREQQFVFLRMVMVRMSIFSEQSLHI